MSKYYLYAAAVQGIQDFIFKTNELRHIVGASELVEQICTSDFKEFEVPNGESVVRAAGNIKYVFTNLEDCKKAFRNFPKKIMIKAPGITVSQAVYGYDNDDEFGKAIDEVEQLLKVQRNKPPKSVLSGLMGIKRANNTGLPVTAVKGEFLDDATRAKLAVSDKLLELSRKSFGQDSLSQRELAYNISDITGKNDWIAIIHADGNGVGKVVQKIGTKKAIFKEFSKKLDDATKAAANEAYKAIMGRFGKVTRIPIRPVVLSGDDMTVIIRGDLAVEYTKTFIVEFESKTKELLGHILTTNSVFDNGADHLTACAGITFIKSSYPFYYGYQLAEELCGQAKKDTKALAKEDCLPDSCLMFHKVQDSFITNYEDIVERELTAQDDNSESIPLFKAGPYYIAEKEKRHTVDELKDLANMLDLESSNGVKSGVRNWISLRLEGSNKAKQRKERMTQLFTEDNKLIIEELTNEENGSCIAYDVLAYHTIMNQEINNE